MKKLLAAICLMILSAPAFAQMQSGGFHLDRRSTYYGLRLGFTSASIGGDYDLDSRAGLTIGGIVGLKCSPSVPLFLESGLYYTEKGGKEGHVKVREDYLEIPFLMKYGFNVGGDVAILPYVGPTFGFGIAGKTKIDGLETDTFDDNGMKRFDVGIKLGCGVEWNMLYGELGYHWGVTNISDNELDAFNRAFYMNIGINF